MIESIKSALFEPGPVKTPLFATAGWASWSSTKGTLEAVIITATAAIVTIHLVNALVRQWCPVRRLRMDNCDQCPLAKTILCARCTRDND